MFITRFIAINLIFFAVIIHSSLTTISLKEDGRKGGGGQEPFPVNSTWVLHFNSYCLKTYKSATACLKKIASWKSRSHFRLKHTKLVRKIPWRWCKWCRLVQFYGEDHTKSPWWQFMTVPEKWLPSLRLLVGKRKAWKFGDEKVQMGFLKKLTS